MDWEPTRRFDFVRLFLDLTADALTQDPALDGFSGSVADSGEGRWTVAAAIAEAVPAGIKNLLRVFSSNQGPDVGGSAGRGDLYGRAATGRDGAAA